MFSNSCLAGFKRKGKKNGLLNSFLQVESHSAERVQWLYMSFEYYLPTKAIFHPTNCFSILQVQFLFTSMWRFRCPDPDTRETKCTSYIEDSKGEFFGFLFSEQTNVFTLFLWLNHLCLKKMFYFDFWWHTELLVTKYCVTSAIEKYRSFCTSEANTLWGW